jgi:hypothetical protein
VEKISKIVPGNSRVASTDLKSASAVRPGAPSFGRPMGESPATSDKFETTASRANAIQTELNEAKRSNSQDRVVAQMSDSFFQNRIRGPDNEIAAGGGVIAPKGKASIKEAAGETRVQELATRPEFSSTDEMVLGDARNGEITQPVGFKPRGSYVDVHA